MKKLHVLIFLLFGSVFLLSSWDCGPLLTTFPPSSNINMTSGVTTISTGSYTFDCIHIGGNAVVNIDGAVTIKTKCFTLDAGATITGVGRGYGPESGPGAGGTSFPGQTSLGSGGGHGGAGGPVSFCTFGCTVTIFVGGGSAYDDPIQPHDMGSGGGWNYVTTTTPGPPYYPSAGGGLLEVIVIDPSSNTLQPATINGTIDMSASGSFGSAPLIIQTSGMGAGGAIWIEASNIAGTGTLLADGTDGTSAWAGSGGGGGIISLIQNGTPFAGTTSAAGGGLAQNGVVNITAAPSSGY